MKNKFLRIVSLLLAVCMMAAIFAACTEEEAKPTEPAHVDYVMETKLDMNSNTIKQEVQWGKFSHVDGDTSHFEVPREFDATGKVKARYLAVNTPESTGQIQEWGKAASRFTEEKRIRSFCSITSIIVMKASSEPMSAFSQMAWRRPSCSRAANSNRPISSCMSLR